MGGYDLYGNWYPRTQDALNAEEAQCAAIDARLARQAAERAESYERKRELVIKELKGRVAELEAEIRALIAAREEE